jgi:hypothetical protein
MAADRNASAMAYFFQVLILRIQVILNKMFRKYSRPSCSDSVVSNVAICAQPLFLFLPGQLHPLKFYPLSPPHSFQPKH